MRNTTVKIGRNLISYGMRNGSFSIAQRSNKGEIFVDIAKHPKRKEKYEVIIQGDNIDLTTFKSASCRNILVSISRLTLPKHREDLFLTVMLNVSFFKTK